MEFASWLVGFWFGLVVSFDRAWGLLFMFHLIRTAFCLFHLLFGGFKISSEVCDASPFCFKTLKALDFFRFSVCWASSLMGGMVYIRATVGGW